MWCADVQEDALKEDSDDEARHNPDERISSTLSVCLVAVIAACVVPHAAYQITALQLEHSCLCH